MVSSAKSSSARSFSILAFGFSVLALALLLASGPGTRLGWWDFRFGLGLFRDSFFAAGAGLLGCLVVLVFLRRKAGGLVPAWAGFVLGLLIAGNGLFWIQAARNVPRIHDITTDTRNPPVFEAVLPLRQKALNPVQYGGPDIARQQQQAYPDIRPLVVQQPPAQVWDACRKAAQAMGWEIVAAREAEGRLEATATTFWFGFKDDVVVRLLPMKDGSRVDVRSLSRVGLSDVGTNARRIREFLTRVRYNLS